MKGDASNIQAEKERSSLGWVIKGYVFRLKFNI